ncbi:DUF5777 family beta-barrel protein [Hymenobacter edaphi]|uniref:DUF5777 family beta-barrel protein n=1 Tax=Hymenobacter edaphi TaxID=2211146 RepID=UPI001FB47180|nr:DUF5777 family beta-barrel protein [Hymenobacter edaphi]
MLTLYPTPLRRLALSGTLLLGLHLTAAAQDDLLQQLEQQATTQTKPDFATATFKGTRIVNGQSVETPASGSLQFLIGHRFGQLNSGAYNFFGLDQATIRLGLEYGLNDRLAVGLGRSSLDKTFDGFVKYKALRQHSGPRAVPVTLTLLATSTITTLKFPVGADRSTAARMAYSYQALLARKFSPGLSAQLMPTLVHRNLVPQPGDDNDVYAVGGAVRQKLTKRIALTAEYYYVLSEATAQQARNPLAVGFDIETGGHVFQLHFTNAQGMVDPLFIPRTTGNFFEGDIFFGFNISRSFGLNHRKP